MIKTQVQIPDELFERAKRLAAAKEWSFAELVRRGLEQMTLRCPIPDALVASDWDLPEPIDLGLKTDAFASEDWREEINLSPGAARLIATRLREDAARYDAGS